MDWATNQAGKGIGGLLQAQQQCEKQLSQSLTPNTLIDNVRYQLARNEDERKRLTELLTLLEANPDYERIMTLLGQRY